MEAMKNVTPRDIRAFYLMNGQIIFAELMGLDDDTEDYIIKQATMVMIGQQKNIAMSTAYPFSNIDDTVNLNWRNVTVTTDLTWNKQLVAEYDKFWQQIRAQAAGIILPGQAPGAAPIKPVMNPGRPTIVK